jgi:hypothetical protein
MLAYSLEEQESERDSFSPKPPLELANYTAYMLFCKDFLTKIFLTKLKTEKVRRSRVNRKSKPVLLSL